MSIYIKDAAGNRKKFAGIGLPGPVGKSAYQYAVEGGFTGTEEEFAALMGAVSNDNLLDNWYFMDPINQRGQTEYSGTGYIIDRWYGIRITVKITEEGLVLDPGENDPSSSAITCYPEFKAEQDTVVTISALFKGHIRLDYTGVVGPVTCSSDDWNVCTYTYTIPAGVDLANKLYCPTIKSADKTRPVTIKAAKLELGPTQTLARQDADGNWVLNDPPPDYALELAKCQRYQIFGHMCGTHVAKIANNYRVFLPLPVPLRSTPTISGTPRLYSVESESLITGGTISVTNILKNGVFLTVSGVTEPVYVWFSKEGLDANM